MTNRCPLCGKAEEEINHLLVHCPLVWSLWKGLISLPEADWVCPLQVKDEFMMVMVPSQKEDQKALDRGSFIPKVGYLENEKYGDF